MSFSRVCVIGDGGWGTALALVLHSGGRDVRLWSAFDGYAAELRAKRENVKFLPGIELPADLTITADAAEAAADAELVVIAVPTQYIRGVLESIGGALPRGAGYVSVSKGIEQGTLLRPTEVARELLGLDAVAGMFGPSHAEEVARGLPTTVVAASARAELAGSVQEAFMTPRFRVYTNDDLLGCELGAALKNVVALSAGICHGLGFGDNAKAALLTRGLAEIARLGVALGAKPMTFLGLTGMGDLITTCFSPYGRNRSVGIRIGEGESLGDITSSTEQVAEGVPTTESALVLAARAGVELPIAEAVSRILFEGASPAEAVRELMSREAKPEFYGMSDAAGAGGERP